MASIDIIDGEETINVTEVVGATKAVNDTDDVMVVQGMLAFIYSFPAFKQNKLKVPEVTGTFDQATAKLIPDYQHRANLLAAKNRSPLRVLEDGRVSPARGKTEWGRNMLWTVIRMNFDGGLFAAASQSGSFIDALLKRFPQLKGPLKR